jgi:hypothetical protein
MVVVASSSAGGQTDIIAVALFGPAGGDRRAAADFILSLNRFLMDYRTVTAAQAYRGIRNNNPGNIKTGIAWQGAVGDDGTFIIFADNTWGLRAMAKDLIDKINEGVSTITAIITKYAPPSENDTASYISAVATDSGIDANEALGTDGDTLHSLIRAIVNHEEGDGPSAQFVSDGDIDTGITMATDPTTVFRAAVITASAYPTQTVLGVAAGVILLWAIFRRKH